MHKGYLLACIAALGLGILFFLGPNVIRALSQSLNRTLGVLEDSLLERRVVRYVLGLVLFGVSFAMFRLAYLAPLFQK